MALFTSERERRREQKDYERRIFPLGQPQRQAEQALLDTLLAGVLSGNERMYQLIQVRDLLQSEDDPALLEQELKKWYAGRMCQELTLSQRAAVYALALLTQECQSLAEYPTVEQVRQKAEALLAGPLADWPAAPPRRGLLGWRRG